MFGFPDSGEFLYGLGGGAMNEMPDARILVVHPDGLIIQHANGSRAAIVTVFSTKAEYKLIEGVGPLSKLDGIAKARYTPGGRPALILELTRHLEFGTKELSLLVAEIDGIVSKLKKLDN